MMIGALELRAGRMAVVAEPSANHVGSYDRAVRLVQSAKGSGADAIKFQPYQPEDHTRNHPHPAYRLPADKWGGGTLWDLYTKAQTPYSWLPGLIEVAEDLGLPWFASVVSARGLDVLEGLSCPGYKVPSAEVADCRFVELVASVGKPVIISDGMATPSQMAAAMSVVPFDRCVILKCVSEYPAPASAYNLATIRALRDGDIPCGVSDHTTGITIPVMAATLGSVMLEKHLMADDWLTEWPLDCGHSLDPEGFAAMVRAVREAEAAMGSVVLGASHEAGKGWRRRLVAARDLPAGHTLDSEDVTTARCGEGMEPDERSVGRTLTVAVSEGEPLTQGSFTVRAA